jgi:hypothetical protein
MGRPRDDIIPSLRFDSSNHFHRFIFHFIKDVAPTTDDPVVLLFDRRFSHPRSFDVVDLAQKHDAFLLTPPTIFSLRVLGWFLFSIIINLFRLNTG